jgi:alpha-galactosidase
MRPFLLRSTPLCFLLLAAACVCACCARDAPARGWSSWNGLGCNVTEADIRGAADALVSTGLREAGFLLVAIDDCWAQKERDAAGLLQADERTFPGGIPALARYVHARGLRLGIYSSAGTLTCAERAASLGHEAIDAQTWAAWGVDALKYDNCHNLGQPAVERYSAMSRALAATGRPIAFGVCEWGVNQPWLWAPQIANSWRTTLDIRPRWPSVLAVLDESEPYWSYARLGAWNDLDSLEVGDGRLTAEEERSHVSLWVLLRSPLILGCSLGNASAHTLSLLTNAEVLAVHDDPLGVAGRRVWSKPSLVSAASSAVLVLADQLIARALDVFASGSLFRNRTVLPSPSRVQKSPLPGLLEVWAAPLSGGELAVVLFNRGEYAKDVTAQWAHLGLPPLAAMSVRDLWARAELGIFRGSFRRAAVPAHGVAFLRLRPA